MFVEAASVEVAALVFIGVAGVLAVFALAVEVEGVVPEEPADLPQPAATSASSAMEKAVK